MERLSWIIWVGLISSQGSSEEGGKRGRVREGHGTADAKSEVKLPQAKELGQSLQIAIPP